MKTKMIAALIFLLTGCSLGPHYVPMPELKGDDGVPAVYLDAGSGRQIGNTTQIYDRNWRLQFRIKDNNVYDRNWRMQYRIKDGNIYNRSLNLKFRTRR